MNAILWDEYLIVIESVIYVKSKEKCRGAVRRFWTPRLKVETLKCGDSLCS